MAELFHRKIERTAIGFVIAIIAAASVGGIVEIAPLFTIHETVEELRTCASTRRWSWPGATSTSARAATPATAR